MALFKTLYPNCRIQLHAEQRHIQAILSNAQDKVKEVETAGFRQYSRPGFLYWPKKVLGEWAVIFKILSAARKSKPEVMVWLSVFPTGHFLLQLLSKIWLKDQRQIIVLHGELTCLKTGDQKRTDRFLGFILKKSISGSGSALSYIVLGASIRKNLETYHWIPQEKISVVDHPFLYTPPVNVKITGQGLNVCTFGTLKKSKNAQLFFEMAGRFAPGIREGKVSFTTIGQLSEELMAYRSPYVHTFMPSVFIPQSEYEQEIKKYDLALFFYDNDTYSLGASGVVHECIQLGVPFLALRNDYFENMVVKYPVGKLVDSLEEMQRYITEFIDGDRDVFKVFRSSIFSFIEQNSFLLQSERLKSVLRHQKLYP